MNINEWVAEIHENAVAHGFWDEERNFGEFISLCHSELSEALEEDRKGNDHVYIAAGKPEGIAIELLDCVIRIFDYFGSIDDLDVERLLELKHSYNKGRGYMHGKRY